MAALYKTMSIFTIKNKPLYILRHGETWYDLKGKAQGSKPFPLTIESRQVIRDIAQELKNEPIDVIVTSNLTRAAQTAKIVSDIINKPIGVCDYRLIPWDYGDYVGKDEDFISQQQKDVYIPNPDEPMPDGESFNEFKDRLIDAIEGILAQYSDRNVLFISHSCNERLMRAWNKAGRDRRSVDIDEFNTPTIGAGEWEVLKPVAKATRLIP